MTGKNTEDIKNLIIITIQIKIMEMIIIIKIMKIITNSIIIKKVN